THHVGSHQQTEGGIGEPQLILDLGIASQQRGRQGAIGGEGKRGPDPGPANFCTGDINWHEPKPATVAGTPPQCTTVLQVNQGRTFGRAASAYDHARPTYPAEAISWLLPGGPR